MAESLWRQDRINENAEAIAIQAGKFIDKFNGLHDDFNKAKGYFKNANEFLDKAQGKLESAPGNLKGQIKKLEDLGAKAKKISS
jgi:DNA recombination protein RmuC